MVSSAKSTNLEYCRAFGKLLVYTRGMAIPGVDQGGPEKKPETM